MQYLTQFMQLLYDYIFTLIGIDFTGLSLPQQVIDMYAYVEQFFQIVVIFFFLYLVYNTLYFIFSLGSVRR